MQPPPPPPIGFTQAPSLGSLDEQLSALMRQQQVIRGQDGMEFIVETKIKTVDGGRVMSSPSMTTPAPQAHNTVPDSATNRNYFMRTFDNQLASQMAPPNPSEQPPMVQSSSTHQRSSSSSQQMSAAPQSSLIKIPLLTSRYLEKPEREQQPSREPNYDSSRHPKLPYLDTNQPVYSPPQILRPPISKV